MPFDVLRVLNYTLYIVIIILLSTMIYYLINIGNKNVNPKNRIVLDLETIRRFIIIVGILLFLIYLMTKYPIILHTIITIIISAVIAYVINPLVKILQKKGIRRDFSIILVYILIVGIFVMLFVMMIPSTIKQLTYFANRIPMIIDQLREWAHRLQESIFKNNVHFREMNVQITEKISEILYRFQDQALSSLMVKDSGSTVIKNLSRVILVPVLSFYFINDKEHIIAGIKGIIPQKRKARFLSLMQEIDNVNSGFVRGRLIMALFVGVATGIFLFLCGLDFAIIIGIITCIADIIPYVGPFLGFLPAIILALIQSPFKALLVAFGFVAIQWLENNIIAPKVLSKRVGLNPVVILVCLIVGGGMFGFVGMIIAVPIVATLKTIYTFYSEGIHAFLLGRSHDEIKLEDKIEKINNESDKN